MRAKTVIVIGGPTASGKTALAIEAAIALNTEIISADSRQCYKELKIGVARPSDFELSRRPHHFIASHSIFDDVNAAIFESYALKKLDDIFKTADVAVVVGGTGLYLKALLDGLDELPQVGKEVRQSIADNYRQNGLKWLQEAVSKKDPMFWKTAEQQNPARLLRALELLETTGMPMQQLRQGTKKQRPFQALCFSIDMDREALYQNINKRVDNMMADGLQAEAEGLFRHQHLQALQTVGYAELFSFFRGETDLPSAVAAIKQNTRRYAKRQQTWFKNSGSYRRLSAENIRVAIREWAATSNES